LWDRDWSESYKSEDSLNHPHRGWILGAISIFEPIGSIFEVGCGGGANLIRISEIYPEVSLCGYDTSDAAMKTIQHVGVLIQSFENIAMYPKCGIVLTDATAIYVSGSNIKSFIEMLKHYANKAIVMCEWHSEEGPFIHEGHWVHNYKELLPGCKVEKIPPEAWPESKNWKEFGHIITYETS